MKKIEKTEEEVLPLLCPYLTHPTGQAKLTKVDFFEYLKKLQLPLILS